MNMKYLINDHVIFDSDANCLFSTDSEAIKVTLHTPASQCLLLLVQNKGEILSQRFLFEHIWGKNGAFVSANALYQNIAIVRKGLKSAGIEEDIVQTVPKIGIKFTGEVALYEPPPKPAEVKSTELASSTPADVAVQDSISEEPVAPSFPVVKPEEPEQIRVPVLPMASSEPETSRVKIKSRYYFIAALIFCVLSVTIFWQQKSGNSFFADYHLIGKVNGCTLISSYHDKSVATQAFNILSKNGGLTCSENNYAYLTINRLPEGSTIMMCDQPAEKSSAQCINYIFLEATVEKH